MLVFMVKIEHGSIICRQGVQGIGKQGTGLCESCIENRFGRLTNLPLAVGVLQGIEIKTI